MSVHLDHFSIKVIKLNKLQGLLLVTTGLIPVHFKAFNNYKHFIGSTVSTSFKSELDKKKKQLGTYIPEKI